MISKKRYEGLVYRSEGYGPDCTYVVPNTVADTVSKKGYNYQQATDYIHMRLDAERFRESVYPAGGFASGEYIFGPLGIFFAKILVRTPVTPNQVTWFWGGMMVLSSLLSGGSSLRICSGL